MNTTTRISTAERFGHWLGRGWLGYVHVERRVAAWMVGKGVPEAVAVALVWVVKLAVLGVLLYVAFWVALMLLFMMGAGRIAANGSAYAQNRWTQKDELRYGEAGFGLYASNGQRIDPHDPNDPFDE